MIVKFILAKVLGRLFGEGFGADLAGRGVVYLADEARSAVRREPVRITTTRMKPGETYTIITRPRPTRRERKLAASQRSTAERFRKASRPTRAQVRSAKKLSSTQRRLDRAKPDSRRHERLAAREHRRGDEFDRRMRPKRRQLKLAADLTALDAELGDARAESFERARRSAKLHRRRPRVKVYD